MNERHGALGHLLLVEMGVPGERLPDEHREERQAEHEAEGVGTQELAHRRHRPNSAIAAKYIRASPLTSR